MGNSKSQPKEAPISMPKGDIFGQPKAFGRFPRLSNFHKVEQPKYGSTALQIIEQPRVPIIHDIGDLRDHMNAVPKPVSCQVETYRIWRSEVDKSLRPDQMNHYQAKIEQHAKNEYELGKRARQIQLQREKAMSELLSNKVSPRPTSSLNSICDFAKRYTNWTRLDNIYFSPKPERPELTDDMIKIIEKASSPHPPQEVLAQIDGVDISRKDIRTLTGLNWLNDEVINAYLFLIVTRGKKFGQKSVYAFNTFFYPKLRESSYTSVKRWTRKVDIFSYDFLLIPVHLGNHWCLAVVDFSTKTISYYDSLGGSPNGCCDTLLDYLRYESNDKKMQNLDDENWRLINSYSEIGIPVQCNGSDCGVFACTFAEYITRNAKLNFTQVHMDYFRRKMIYELITKELLQ